MIKIEEIPYPSTTLFKYQPFNEYSLQNMEKSEVYFAQKSKLNDPHEIGFQLESYDDFKSKEIFLAKRREKYFKDSGYLDSIITMLSSEQEEKKYREDTKYLSELILNAGILSLTTDPKNRLMWSHYANSYQGFCLEFESSFLQKHDIPVYPADYVSEHPILSICELRDWQYQTIKSQFPHFTLVDLHQYYQQNFKSYRSELTQQLLISMLTAKHMDWKYEDEWRYISINHGPIKYNSSNLKSIIFGSKMTEDSKKIITKTLKKQKLHVDFKFKQIVQHEGSFDLKIIDIL